MSNEFIVRLADILQLSTIIISIAGFLPQLLRLYRSKSSNELSLATWALWSFGSSATLFYAAVHHFAHSCCLPLLITAIVNFVLTNGTLALVVLYRAPRMTQKNLQDRLQRLRASTAIDATSIQVLTEVRAPIELLLDEEASFQDSGEQSHSTRESLR